MLVVDFDPTRSRESGQYHVRLIDGKSGDYGNDARHQNQVGYWCDGAHLASGVLASVLGHIEDDDLDRIRKYARPKKRVVNVTWHPTTIDAAIKRLVGFRDGQPAPRLLQDEQAVMVAIDALRAIQKANADG